MKKSVEIKIGDKTHELCYNIRNLEKYERLLGKSITFLFATGTASLVRQTDIRFTVSGMIVGLHLKDEDEAYDLIDLYCKEGGSLDRLNAKIIEAVLATGLFTTGAAKELEKVVPKETKQEE